MFSFLYNFLLALFLLIKLPQIIWVYLTKKKKLYNIAYRLGIKKHCFPIPKDAYVIWVHSVSLGETKASVSYLKKIKKKIPNSYLIVSSTTKTGLDAAKKNLNFAEKHIFLPFDFSWTFSSIFKTVRPKLFILTETDFWYHMLKMAKKYGAKNILINGKLSQKSFKRFKRFSFFTRRLFSYFDTLCVQNEENKKRFEELNINLEKIIVTGNLKFNPNIEIFDNAYVESWRKHFAINPHQKVITIASTHFHEEKQLLQTLLKVWEKYSYKILLAPRHPERTAEMIALLKELQISFQQMGKISNKVPRTEKLILIDKMGFLPLCYKLSDLAIVGGSFVKHIGGHNILEPVLYDIPVLFGPYMHGQKDMKQLILHHRCGQQVSSLKNLNDVLIDAIENPHFLTFMKTNIHCLKESLENSLEFTWKATTTFMRTDNNSFV